MSPAFALNQLEPELYRTREIGSESKETFASVKLH